MILLMLTASAQAVDGEMSLSESTLQRYADSVAASGERTTSLYAYDVCPTCEKWELVDHEDSPSQRLLVCREWRVDCCTFFIGKVEWAWTVVNPRVVVRECGIRLKGLLNVVCHNNQRMIPFSLPVTVSFESNTGKLKLHVEQDIDDIVMVVSGTTENLGSVNVARYFDTSLLLTGTFDTYESRSVTGQAESVDIRLLNGSLKITGNIGFQ
jgi:hypothetical protein